MPHTFHFRQFLGQPLPPELRRLFSNLELWRQRGGARPLIVLEQGDHNVRFYLEQWRSYRNTPFLVSKSRCEGCPLVGNATNQDKSDR